MPLSKEAGRPSDGPLTSRFRMHQVFMPASHKTLHKDLMPPSSCRNDHMPDHLDLDAVKSFLKNLSIFDMQSNQDRILIFAR